MKSRFAIALCVISAVMAAPTASAGVFSDELARCLVRSTSKSDKQQLMVWMFATYSLNPAISRYVSISRTERVHINKRTARLFERLIGEDCSSEASKALRYEGFRAFRKAFRVLGRIAGRQMASTPAVSEGMTKFIEYINMEHLRRGLKIDTR